MINRMNYDVAKVILFDKNDKLFIYLRDDKPTIPYPNMWDLLGGGIEPGETAEEAGIREVEEEIGVKTDQLETFGHYVSEEGFRMTILVGRVDAVPENLLLTEGQRLTSIALADLEQYEMVPILAQAVRDLRDNQAD